MRFYFDIDDDHYSAKDGEGIDLPNIQAAHQHANRVSTSVACDVFDANGSKVIVTVRDDLQPLLSLTLTLSREEFPIRERPV